MRVLALLELAGLLVWGLAPPSLPQFAALLFVGSRWAIYFVARQREKMGVLRSVSLAAVPGFGFAWWRWGRATTAVSVSAAVAEPEEPAEWERIPGELLQLNIQLMSAAMSRQASAPGRVGAAPLIDIASGADYRTKQAVVIQLRELRALPGVEALKILRGHSDPDLQYLSATALASLEQSENAAIQAGEERVLERPRDFSARIQLARAQIFLCRSGLLGSSMVRSLLARAEEHLRQARALAADEAQGDLAADRLAEVLELRGKRAEALQALSAARALSADGLERLASLRLGAGDRAGLSAACARILDPDGELADSPAYDRLRAAARAWGAEGGRG